MRTFVNHIELWLSAAGIVVVWIVTLALPGVEPWKVAAVTALGVSVVHGILFWTVRRRQRRGQAKVIHEIREMLTDQVKNQLAVIAASLPAAALSEYAEQIQDVTESVDAIGEMMDGLTEEKLQAWKQTYSNASEHYAVA
ncbi:MAG TPA: hypothetical protein VGB53_02665 [Rubricoccaceae bacterium]|jgi:hypothetical protein